MAATRKSKGQPKKVMVKRKDILNPAQELFCKLYATKGEYFANGTQSYAESHGLDIELQYKTCLSAANRMLSDSQIIKRINELIEQEGLNDQYVDKQLLFLISQKTDLRASLGAISEYNKLKARITAKLEIKAVRDTPEQIRESMKRIAEQEGITLEMLCLREGITVID